MSKQGHDVVVVTINPSKYLTVYDKELSRLVSTKLKVYRTFAGFLHHFRYRFKNNKVISKLNKMLRPLSMVEWFPVGLFRTLRLCYQNKFDLIYTHADPFLSNFLGYISKKIFNIPWIMYVGDPRYFGAYSQCKWLLKHLEHASLRLADNVLVNCEETLEEYLKYFPGIKTNKYNVITDGYPLELYKNTAPKTSKKFRILYTGAFYPGVREPLELFKAIKLCSGLLEVIIAGYVPEEYKKKILSAGLLSNNIIFLGHLPHEQIKVLQKGADVLLSIGWVGGFQLPGKMFDYLAAERPILVIKYDTNDVSAKLVEKYNRGLVCGNSIADIKASIEKLYELWRSQQLNTSFDLSAIEDFDWNKLAKKLETLILNTVENHNIKV